MKKLLIALLCLLPLSAQAQTSKSGLISEVNTNLPDNATGLITPAILRTTLIDMINSWLDLNGTSGFNCGINTWMNAYSNLSTPSCAQLGFSNLNGNIAITQIAGGTGASNTTFLRGDNTWTTPAGAGTLTGYTNTAGTGLTTSGTCSITTGNNTSTPCQYALSASRQTLPTISVVTGTSHTGGFAANGSGTYTTPANALWIDITIVGGGGGGGGGNNSTAGGIGGATCWNTTGSACTTPVYSAGGGAGGNTGGTSIGGVVTGSGTCLILSMAGSGGGVGGANASPSINTVWAGGTGGPSILGGAGPGQWAGVGINAAANSGSGGGGGAVSTTAEAISGFGGGSGAACKTIITTPAATYTYVVGGGGAGASGGTGGFAGGNGAGGQIIIIEHYGS